MIKKTFFLQFFRCIPALKGKKVNNYNTITEENLIDWGWFVTCSLLSNCYSSILLIKSFYKAFKLFHCYLHDGLINFITHI